MEGSGVDARGVWQQKLSKGMVGNAMGMQGAGRRRQRLGAQGIVSAEA